MVKWYDPRQLSATGIKSVLSALFGNFSDKREIQAALELSHNGEKPYYDYSENKELWVDYVADLGDGFDSTHTVAWLLAQEQLKLSIPTTGEEKSLPKGKVLVMGGDQVYPTPERDEYEQRFKLPYSSAFTQRDKDGKVKKVSPEEMTHLFALPGNHDWYDGLTNFLKVFCQQRTIGNLLTRQHRSYFAIRLPHNVWLWGIDVALSADIDKPQRDYFELVAGQMKQGDKVILCTPEPAWVYQEIQAVNESFDRLNYFVNRFITHGDGPKGFTPGKNFQLLAVIAGDLHHYSHYEGEGPLPVDAEGNATGKKEKYHCITAGGGGAFMHVTHNLPASILDVWYSPVNVKKGQEIAADERKTTLISTYPEKRDSRRLSWRNFLFPFINWEFTLFMSGFHMLLIWFIQSTTRYTHFGESYFEQIYHCPDPGHLFSIIANTVIHNPLLFIIIILVPLGFMKFAESNFKRSKRIPQLAGLAHGLAQVTWFFVFTFLIVDFNYFVLSHNNEQFNSELSMSLMVVAECLLLGGLVSSFMMGLYLFMSSRLIRNHDTEASSSILYRHCKNFLRIHVSEKEVRIYPIAVDKIKCKWQIHSKSESPYWTPENGAPACRLIEDDCISIPLNS